MERGVVEAGQRPAAWIVGGPGPSGLISILPAPAWPEGSGSTPPLSRLRLRRPGTLLKTAPAVETALAALKAGVAGFERRRREAWFRRRRTVRTLVVLDIAALVWWVLWLFNPQHIGAPALYAFLVLAESFNVIQVLGYWLTVWSARVPTARPKTHVIGSVDVFICTYNEPVEIVERTVRAAVAIRRRHRTYLLDDGNRPEMREVAARCGARYIARTQNRGAKAGNLNNAIRLTSGDFFAVFDADHAPHPAFLDRMLPFMADPRMGLVQSPQYYGNRRRSYVAGAAMDQQEIFFGPICEGKDGLGAVFCCGTNMLIRRSAIQEVGGFEEHSVTEDMMTSLQLHQRGWKSRYVGERLAEGLAPEDLGAYLAQQRRWAQGNLEMLFRLYPVRAKLPLALRLQYAWSGIHYLSGAAGLTYFVIPVLFLSFGIQTVSSASGDFVIHALPYTFLTILILARSLDGKLRFRAVQISLCMFPVWLEVLASVILRRRVGFVVTRKTRAESSFYSLIVPQLALAAITVAAIPVGLLHYAGAATITNICWALFNLLVLSGIVKAARRPRAAGQSSRSRLRHLVTRPALLRLAPGAAAAALLVALFATSAAGGSVAGEQARLMVLIDRVGVWTAVRPPAPPAQSAPSSLAPAVDAGPGAPGREVPTGAAAPARAEVPAAAAPAGTSPRPEPREKAHVRGPGPLSHKGA